MPHIPGQYTDHDIEYLSIVPKGANNMPIVLKEDGAFEIQTVCKYQDLEGELTTLVYVPNYTDKHQNWATPQVIKKAMQSFAKKGNKIDFRHDGKQISSDKMYVFSNFQVQKNDERFANWKDKMSPEENAVN